MSDARKLGRFPSSGGLIEAPNRLQDRRRSSSLSDLARVSYCAVFLPDGAYKTIQVNTLCRTTGQVIAIVLEKSNNPRLPDDYRLVIKYADQSDSWLENGSNTDIILSPVVVKIFLKLAEEQSAQFCSMRTKLIKKAKKNKPKPKKDKGPDEEENLRDLHNAWFAGKMSKVPCEKAVLSGKHGDYLIRTMPGHEAYVLVVNDTKTICNFLISTGDGSFRMGPKSFVSLLELVKNAKLTPFVGNYGIKFELQYPAPGGVVMEKGSASPRMGSRLGASSISLTPSQGSPRLQKPNRSLPTQGAQASTHAPASPPKRQAHRSPMDNRTKSESDDSTPYLDIPDMPRMSAPSNSPRGQSLGHANQDPQSNSPRGQSLGHANQDPPTPRGRSLTHSGIRPPPRGGDAGSPGSPAGRGLPPPPQPPPSSAGPVDRLPPSMELIAPRQPSPRKNSADPPSSRDSAEVPHQSVEAEIAAQEAKVKALQQKKKSIQRGVERASMLMKEKKGHLSQSTVELRPQIPAEDDDSSRSSSTINLDRVGESNSEETWQADPSFAARGFERRQTEPAKPERKMSQPLYDEIPGATAALEVKKFGNNRIARNRPDRRSAKDALPRPPPGGRMAHSKSLLQLTVSEGAGRPTYAVGSAVFVKGALVGASSKIVVAKVVQISDERRAIQLEFTGDGENSTYESKKWVTWGKFDENLASNTSSDSGPGSPQGIQGQPLDEQWTPSPPPMRGRSSTGPSRHKAKSLEGRNHDPPTIVRADRPKSDSNMLDDRAEDGSDVPRAVPRYSFSEEGAGMPPPPPLVAPSLSTPKARPRLGTRENSLTKEPNSKSVQQERPKQTPRSENSLRRQPRQASSPDSQQGRGDQSPSSGSRSRRPVGKPVGSRKRGTSKKPLPSASPLKGNPGEEGIYMNTPAQGTGGVTFITDDAMDPAASYREDPMGLYMNTPGESSTDPAPEDIYQNTLATPAMSIPKLQPKSGLSHHFEGAATAPAVTSGYNEGNEESMYMDPEVIEKVRPLPEAEDLYMDPEVIEKVVTKARNASAWASVGNTPAGSDREESEGEEEDWDEENENYDTVNDAMLSGGGRKLRKKSGIARSMIRRLQNVTRQDAGLSEDSPAVVAGASEDDDNELYAVPEVDIARHRAASNTDPAASQTARLTRPQSEELYGVPETMESAPQKKPNAVILPSGWVKVQGQNGGRDYYFHNVTRKTSWTLPSD